MSKSKGYVGTKAMAQVLGCTPMTVRGYCEEGLFPGAKRLPGSRGDWRIPRKFFLDTQGGSTMQQQHVCQDDPGQNGKYG